MERMLTVELEIAQRAEKYRGEGLTNLNQFMDRRLLLEVMSKMNTKSATGVDGQDWTNYLIEDHDLDALLGEFKSGRYRAPWVRRVYIPKGRNEKRPLGIPTIRDKILQGGVRALIEPIYEQDFKDFSYGFRKGRSMHMAVEELFRKVSFGGMRYIIDADIRNYFGTISHEHLRNFISRRVKDGVVQRAINKWLKAGILEGEEVRCPDEGTPQGGSISPLLSNIYLHYVLDEWYDDEIKPLLGGKSFMVRFADDFVIGFENYEDAQRVMAVLPKRFGKYNLQLHPDKTKLLKLETGSKQGDRSFDFLGFTHYMGLSRKGKPVLKRKTSKKKLTISLGKMRKWVRENRHMKPEELIKKLNKKLRGHYNYYGITFNSRSLNMYYHEVARILFKWLNRRGGKKKWTWERFNKLILEWHKLLRPKIYHSHVLAKPSLEEPYAGKPLVRVCGGAGR